MKLDWILEVLSDLKKFSLENDMKLLAEQLDDAHMAALMEVSQVSHKKKKSENLKHS
jgi:hypothetical protein